jgi:hypothetical protein
MTGPGAVIGSDGRVPLPEEIAASLDRIRSLEGAREFEHLHEVSAGMMAMLAPQQQ